MPTLTLTLVLRILMLLMFPKNKQKCEYLQIHPLLAQNKIIINKQIVVQTKFFKFYSLSCIHISALLQPDAIVHNNDVNTDADADADDVGTDSEGGFKSLDRRRRER